MLHGAEPVNYPTLEEVEKADYIQLLLWLMTPRITAIAYYEMVLQRIRDRYNEQGGTERLMQEAIDAKNRKRRLEDLHAALIQAKDATKYNVMLHRIRRILDEWSET